MKNILVYMPAKVFGIVCSYPLIHKIHQFYGEVKIHIIVDEGLDQFCLFFPFDVSVHVLPTKKKGILGIHHFAANLHEVFNVDIFFDLHGGFLGAYLGKSFGANERAGFVSKFNRLLLTHKVVSNISSLDRKYFELLEEVTQESFSDFYLGQFDDEVKIDNVIPLFPVESKKTYILVFLDDFVENQSIWRDLFFGFDHIHFIFFKTEDIESSESTINLLKEYDQERGLFRIKISNSYEDLKDLLINANGVITNQEWLANITSTFNTKSYLFLKQMSDLKKFRHILYSGAHIEYDKESLIKLYGNNNAFIDIRIPSEVTDYIAKDIYPICDESEK